MTQQQNDGMLNCYRCGERTPEADGPLCWACKAREGQGVRPESYGSAPLARQASRLEAVTQALANFVLVGCLLASVLLVVFSFQVPSGQAWGVSVGLLLVAAALFALTGIVSWCFLRAIAIVAGYVAWKRSIS